MELRNGKKTDMYYLTTGYPLGTKIEGPKEFIKRLYGVNRKKEVYMALVQGRGIVENVRDANVVEDWDITRLGIGQAIIGLPGKEPFLFQFKKA